MAFDWTQLIGPAIQGAAGLYGANQSAEASQATGAQAAQAAQFRPVGVTSRFGTSGFQYSPEGQLTGAGYQVAPDVAAMREGLLGMAGTGLSQAQQQQAAQPGITAAGQGLFNLGQQYVAQTPQGAAQNWMTQQQGLLAPGREQQLAQLTNQQQQQGRLGLATGATTAGYGAGAPGLLASNPQMAAYYNAMAQQDAGLAAQAQQQGQAQTTFGQGLMTGGLNLTNLGYGSQVNALAPYTANLQGAQNIESMGQQALTQGIGLGSAAAANQLAGAEYGYYGNKAANTTATTAQAAALKGLTDPIAALISSLVSSKNPGTTLTQQQYANISGY